MERSRDGQAGQSGRAASRPTLEREPGQGMAWEYGALLDEALGGGSGQIDAPEAAPTRTRPVEESVELDAPEVIESADPLEDSDLFDSSMVVRVNSRPPAADVPFLTEEPPAFELSNTLDAPGPARVDAVDPDRPPAATAAAPPAVVPTPTPVPVPAPLPAAPPVGTVAQPALVDGRVEIDSAWANRPLLRQPLILKPGASVGSPGGQNYIANPGSLTVSFVPAAESAEPSAGTYYVNPAEVVAAAGVAGVLTDELMTQLSGCPYRAGPPTPVQLAIIDAARQAGLSFGTAP